MADGGGARNYSCKTASETLKWIHAIIDFLKPYRFFLDAHVVNFFKDRLWEAVDKEWMDCLRKEPAEKLLLIPSGVVQVGSLHCLGFHFCCSNINQLLGFCFVVASLMLNTRNWIIGLLRLKNLSLTLRSLSLPRDQADLQEIQALAGVVDSIARRVGAHTIVDVGSGYLAQVLSFEHELSVIAIDASSHHGSITDARAKRIEKYYAAKKCKSRSEDRGFCIPKTVTCRVLSPAMLKDIGSSLRQVDEMENPTIFRDNTDSKPLAGDLASERLYSSKTDDKSTMVLAGLHACGDLSVTMLRTFMECDEVKAVISIGCCYNLLSEEGIKEGSLSVLPRDYNSKPSNRAAGEGFVVASIIGGSWSVMRTWLKLSPKLLKLPSQRTSSPAGSTYAKDPLLNEHSSYPKSANKETNSADRYSMFVKFCKSGLGRLGFCVPQDIEFSRLWEEAEEFYDLVGPYWTLRAALGPVLETILLLDRLLFLQEQGNVLIQTVLLPIFDPKTRSSESAGQRQAMNYASYGQWWEAVDTYSESFADYLECRLELFSNSAVIVWNFGLSLRIRPSYSDLTVGIACTLAGSNAIHDYINVR
ncbi:protein RRNAD1 [Sesamum angolense]|uniref:Protein RRNAD1 n=1 Tax=Sesamum angolense TaxID=2727404 RepID=A0AAE1WS61_9LAMI|nr:protein RRNAD1 [Sesamum angolense]